MDINTNLITLNSIIACKRFSIKERLLILEIARVSKDSKDLMENLKWELNFDHKS